MSINSMIFLTAFLPVVFVLDRLCVRKTALKNILLLLASLVFYAWGDPVYIVLLLVSIAANYGIGLLLGCQRGGESRSGGGHFGKPGDSWVL